MEHEDVHLDVQAGYLIFSCSQKSGEPLQSIPMPYYLCLVCIRAYIFIFYIDSNIHTYDTCFKKQIYIYTYIYSCL